MTATKARAYLSPTLVLLALDWPDGETQQDFLGFAIKRTPGFLDLTTKKLAASSWLPNRIDFNGPPAKGQPDFPSKDAPIQKFLWWDARLEGLATGAPINYEVWAATGDASHVDLTPATNSTVAVQLPPHVEFGVGTWFNRAVMSSQAFSRMVDALNLQGAAPTPEQALVLRQWLANGMEAPVAAFISAATSLAGAIYHLTDDVWIIPALDQAMESIKAGLVYDSHTTTTKAKKVLPSPNDPAIQTLNKVKFFPRDKTQIMHNKFLVDGDDLQTASKGAPARLTCGSANYTTEGLTSQANLVHTFESPELAALYYERYLKLKPNPTKGATAQGADWSNTVSVGDCGVRVFYSPEPGKPGSDSVSMETIVEAVHGATSSVVFCLFTPTDQALRDACFAVGDAGKTMFGLVNHTVRSEPTPTPTSTGKIPADQLAALEIYHRSRDKKDVIGAEYFDAADLPAGFDLEMNLFPGDNPPPYPPVIIHHKFIVIDAETDAPTIYTGSANMSGNSVFGNDENLLEIKGSPRLARIYLAEFLRLYEHYRARAQFIALKKSGKAPQAAGFALRKDRSWADKYYVAGSPEAKARVRLLSLD